MSNRHAHSQSSSDRREINVLDMLDMLHEIHEEARGDAAMRPFARSIGSAIRVLRELRETAQAVLMEAESEARHPARTN
jgi:uncharacterized iron-regulated membrane protein